MNYRILLVWIGLICFPLWNRAQTGTALEVVPDTSRIAMAADSTVRSVVQQADSLPFPDKVKFEFKPDPKKAVLMALVPGLGQIYNRKYWKLPIVYGGLMGCMYAITWNNKNYQDYSQAYVDIMDSDPRTNSFMDFLPPGYDASSESIQNQLKNTFRNKISLFHHFL